MKTLWHANDVFTTFERIKAGIVGEITVEQGDERLLLLPRLGPVVLHAARFLTEMFLTPPWRKSYVLGHEAS